MASATSNLTRLPCPSNFTPFPELDSHLDELRASVKDKIASIRNISIAPDNREILSDHIGVGICIDPNFVLTSARVVGRIADISTTGAPPLYKAYIGGTAALVFGPNRLEKLQPVAVSFASDLAVLKLVEREGKETPLSVCAVASSAPEKESLLMTISYNLEYEWGFSIANVRAVGQKTILAKAPWPLDDALPWLEYDWMAFYRGPPPPSSVLFGFKTVTGSVSQLNGCPWFNLYGELVGIGSWVLNDDPADLSVGYAAPLSNIWPVIDYAKTKGPEDRVVMDSWIDSEVIGGDHRIDSEVVIYP